MFTCFVIMGATHLEFMIGRVAELGKRQMILIVIRFIILGSVMT